MRRFAHQKVPPPPTELICPYCEAPTKRVTGKVVYPNRPDLRDKAYYHCAPCRAHVGCHPGSVTPLGKLANPELRWARMQAHQEFDPIWKKGEMHRRDAYRWLAEQLGIEFRDCHIGMFDLETCRKAIRICRGRK